MSNQLTWEKPLRLEAAAESLTVSVKTVRRLIRDRALRAFKIRGRWFVRGSDIQAYFEQQLSIQGGNSR